jgi:hypothetical protein
VLRREGPGDVTAEIRITDAIAAVSNAGTKSVPIGAYRKVDPV